MRLFIALDIDDEIRAKISRFVEGVRGFAPEARWVRPESLHVTLKFIGQWPDDKVNEIQQALKTIQSRALEIHFRGYGFFPNPNAARVFWIGIQAGPELASLAGSVDVATAPLGIAREEHPFSPHLTLARGSGGSGSPQKRKDDRRNQSFAKLQERLSSPGAIDFGAMPAREFFLYRSELSPTGSRYTKISAFPLA